MTAADLISKIQHEISRWRQRREKRPLTIEDVDRLSSVLEDVCDDAAETINAEDKGR